MTITQKILISSLLAIASSTVVAQPMPNSIVVNDKAVVPIVKTQIIRRIDGQAPVRSVQATIFEVTNKGQDIVAREVVMQDHESTFSDKHMSNPVIKTGGVIVPTSKIELTSTVKQDNQVISASKSIDASGVEFKKDGQAVQRHLQLDQQSLPQANEKMSHAVLSENGTVTKDMVIFDEIK